MMKCMKNDCPTTDMEKQGPKTPNIDHENVKFTGNKPDGEKHSSDGKGHWSGH
jgi:hypothetical protein